MIEGLFCLLFNILGSKSQNWTYNSCLTLPESHEVYQGTLQKAETSLTHTQGGCYRRDQVCMRKTTHTDSLAL